MSALQITLLVFELLFLIVAVFWRTYLVWHKTGINAYRLMKDEYQGDNLHSFMANIFRLTLIGSVLVILLYAFAEQWYKYLGPIQWLERMPLVLFGLLLMVGAFILIVAAQMQMGDSWRIGIDRQNETALIRSGIYRRSRNPIFLGVLVNLAAFFLVLPNAVTLAILVMGCISVRAQVYLEEEHLLQLHGATYDQFRQEVRRWF